eukprot:1790038-Amphidinium_carterae.1
MFSHLLSCVFHPCAEFDLIGAFVRNVGFGTGEFASLKKASSPPGPTGLVPPVRERFQAGGGRQQIRMMLRALCALCVNFLCSL